ncbi:copper transporter [Nocardioides piscis]|uniref:Copper transporter n=1 Tax=Nocardioides piscis TaxID=2714938 RepID=A0A6G7YI67_9ACTN|nr:copper transporter [Nocardioides piscis]QIK76429.1 copper transporter [Nocardioides piscis]
MITFRHYLTTIVAVFLALAVGIVLGGGPLSDVGDDSQSPAASVEASSTPPGTYADGFAGAVGPTLTAGRLDGRAVAVVTMPGVNEETLTALAEQVKGAGGTITKRYALTDQMVAPDQKALVDTLGAQLMTQQGDAVAADATTYDRIGQLLGLAVASTEPAGEEPSAKHAGILDSLGGAGLVATEGDPARRAPLVLLVLGDEPDAEGGDAISAGLTAGLARSAAGVVVAGTVADGGDGQLGRLRGEPVSAEVTTVDGIDVAAGRVTAVLALARSLDERGGAFGASGADGPVPLG